jgi:hypothetical protein
MHMDRRREAFISIIRLLRISATTLVVAGSRKRIGFWLSLIRLKVDRLVRGRAFQMPSVLQPRFLSLSVPLLS